MNEPVKVIKSITRKYGYSLQWAGENPPSWIVGVNHTWAWYRYKRDAVEAATRHNKYSRLAYLRGEIEAERISYAEIAELQDLSSFIDPSDTLLLQWAGVEEDHEL